MSVFRATHELPDTPHRPGELPGALIYIGEHKLGARLTYDYFRCNDCGTDYPQIDGTIPPDYQPNWQRDRFKGAQGD